MLMPADLRPLSKSDQPLLWNLLYHAIFVPTETQSSSRAILDEPDIALYAENWGRDGDMG